MTVYRSTGAQAKCTTFEVFTDIIYIYIPLAKASHMFTCSQITQQGFVFKVIRTGKYTPSQGKSGEEQLLDEQ